MIEYITAYLLVGVLLLPFMVLIADDDFVFMRQERYFFFEHKVALIIMWPIFFPISIIFLWLMGILRIL